MGAVCDPCSREGPNQDDQTHPLTQSSRRQAESSENIEESDEDTPIPVSPTGDLNSSPLPYPDTYHKMYDSVGAPIISAQTTFLDQFATDVLGSGGGKNSTPVLSSTPHQVQESMSIPDMTHIASLAYDEMAQTIRDAEEELKDLRGWLEKKQSAPPYSWQRRWVIVKNGYLLWSDRQITIDGELTEQEKKRWSKSVNLKQILDVVEFTSKKQRKFKLTVKNNDRAWIWKASDRKERDYWINGLNEHIFYRKRKSIFQVCALPDTEDEESF